MDGESIAAVVAYHLDDYSSALEHIQNRREAIEEIKNHLDLHRKDRIYSEYGTFTSRWESNLRAVSFHCLCQLERFEEADELLHHTSPEKLYQKDRDFFLRMVLTHSGSLPSSGDFLRRCWEFYQDEKLPEKTQEKVSRHQALDGGDELGYVRALHSALEAAPAMKEMVNFLLDHKPKSAAQRQLEQLAEQLRAFLADRSPDDPEVQALKASEAYRKVASLLEAKE